ncbi:zinc finger protein 879-like isoform X1 [Aricia agestis]|uniref:zinc finger protein 879-like isoform X1 n=1 Tax=Aricia agestis TaxID=91739 RepID=UPI001C205595|nr:zinc finger protein 879-like isoform X1 [Aricia agestis]
MDSDTWKIENSICRCCHAEGYFFNLGEPRPFCGQTEVYADMIRDIFDIDMRPLPGPLCDLTYTICMSCIFKLREAIQFKKQVQSCEDKFLDYYYTNKLEVKKKDVAQAVIKIEPVVEFKEEYLNEDEFDSNDDTNQDFAMHDDNDDDDEDDDDDEGSKLEYLLKKGKGKGKGKSEPVQVVIKAESAPVKPEQRTTNKKLVKVNKITVPVKKKGGIAEDEKFITRKGEDGAKEYVCKICERVFTKRANFSQHYNHVHLKKRPKVRSCHLCDEKVPGYKRAMHMEEKHGLPAPTCNACGMKFAYPFLVLEHQKKVHMGEKKFACSICGKQVDTKYRLRQHEMVHKSDKPFNCVICDKQFKWKNNLQIHMAMHLNVRKHACNKCPAAFVQTSSLKYHMMKHHPERDSPDSAV